MTAPNANRTHADEAMLAQHKKVVEDGIVFIQTTGKNLRNEMAKLAAVNAGDFQSAFDGAMNRYDVALMQGTNTLSQIKDRTQTFQTRNQEATQQGAAQAKKVDGQLSGVNYSS